MYIYKVTATSDRGGITDRAQIQASSFKAAFGKAGRMAQRMGRSHLNSMTIRLDKIGRKEKASLAENV